ncbi:hypothetical protein [Corynebacterium cystitidis]|uniref:hypothetical protein n=1 Tax=Corynebacterium cystitidis TaxID=35757 RepID=UPI00211DC48F|nr:hypothetical protein [Corynebacterium cystitidis]
MTRYPHRLPEKYYVRRRVAAVLIILVVVAIIVWGLVAWGRSAANNKAADEQVTSAPPTPATPTVELDDDTDSQDDSDPESEDSEEPSTQEETTQNLADKKTCEVSDLQIVASTSKPTYGGGEQPEMFMEVTNPTGADCEIRLDDEALRFEVYDMETNERVWADTDCYPSVVTGEVIFEAGDTRNYQAVWSRTGSAPGQCSNRLPVDDGAYFLYGVIEDNNSDAATFNLTS